MVSSRHRVLRVDREVHHHLLELTHVTVDQRQRRCELQTYAHVFTDRAPEQPLEAAEQIVEVQLTELQRLLAAERQ